MVLSNSKQGDSFKVITKNEQLPCIPLEVCRPLFCNFMQVLEGSSDLFELHRVLSHITLDRIRQYAEATGIKVPQGITLPTCHTCVRSKQHRVPVSRGPAQHSGIPMEVIHSDLCSLNFTSIGGKIYFMSFVDNATKYAGVALLCTKDEAKEKLQAFLAVLQPDQKVRIFCTDGGKEYVNRDVQALLEQQGIKLLKSPAYTPQFNGVAERFNRTIIEMVLTMLIDSNLSRGFWAKALQLAVHIYNRTPHKANGGRSPH